MTLMIPPPFFLFLFPLAQRPSMALCPPLLHLRPTLHHAPCTRTMHHAPRTMHPAPCATLRHALPHAFCTLHHAPYCAFVFIRPVVLPAPPFVPFPCALLPIIYLHTCTHMYLPIYMPCSLPPLSFTTNR